MTAITEITRDANSASVGLKVWLVAIQRECVGIIYKNGVNFKIYNYYYDE